MIVDDFIGVKEVPVAVEVAPHLQDFIDIVPVNAGEFQVSLKQKSGFVHPPFASVLLRILLACRATGNSKQAKSSHSTLYFFRRGRFGLFFLIFEY